MNLLLLRVSQASGATANIKIGGIRVCGFYNDAPYLNGSLFSTAVIMRV